MKLAKRIKIEAMIYADEQYTYSPEQLEIHNEYMDETEAEFLAFLSQTKINSAINEKKDRKKARIARLGYDDGYDGEYKVVR